MRRWLVGLAVAALVSCGGEEGGGSSGGNNDDDGSSGSGNNTAGSGAGSGAGASGSTGSGNLDANADGDCMTDAEEAAAGTDPNAVDGDGDGTSDCDEIACVSNPIDGAEKCYGCGWQHNDPGNLVATGKNDGQVIGDMQLLDTCSETVSLWDFASTADSPVPEPKKYYILLMTAAW